MRQVLKTGYPPSIPDRPRSPPIPPPKTGRSGLPGVAFRGFAPQTHARESFLILIVALFSPRLSRRTRLVSLIIDDYAPYTIKADPELRTTLGRNLLHVDAKAVDWEMGQYVPRTWPANFTFRLQTGSRLLVQIPLASGETREVSFTLKGAKAALATLVGPFTPEYEEQYRREEQRFRDEAVLTKAQAGAEARCGVPVNDKTSPCAAKIRECINAHDADVLQPAEGEALRRCFDAIRP